MKVLSIIIMLSVFYSFGQDKILTFDTIPYTNTSCEMAESVCERYSQQYSGECDLPLTLYYSVNASDLFQLYVSSSSISASPSFINVYGPFDEFTVADCDQVSNYTAPSVTSSQAGQSFSNTNMEAGYYIIAVTSSGCDGSVSISFGEDMSMLSCEDEIDCSDCVTSFAPTPGEYIVSAWVKEKDASVTTTKYDNASIVVSFPGTSISYNLQPAGNIIDGWQKIDSLISIPIGATDIEIQLIVEQGQAYFDDIRFHPFDGSMMSYVYDPISLRLMAELDERNYATLYEYDEEGKLIRVKKETEKGIMTIQENRDNIIKRED